MSKCFIWSFYLQPAGLILCETRISHRKANAQKKLSFPLEPKQTHT